MKELHILLQSIANISDDDWFYFSSKLKQVTLKKKELILSKGETENHLSFIKKGAVRLYIPKIENDLTFGFVFENNFVSAYDSFLTKSPSQYSIQALTTTTLHRLNFNDLEDIYKNTQIGNEIGRKCAEELFLIKSKRELSLLNYSAEERYLSLFREKPELFKEIPLKYIASYIGVTPQALSRIRRRIS
ncbi:cAMP-binding domain of CRP or a regulatory subunit of cAMP-dependent protein kinases [Tenacibaculum sp. MAR_2009_124]|uniref:Crp/Fnr family transcriptional regulator n=1 Tax=Tenacibaculum sp. MAR_2009_124 TaxID=1250059 RepID=UPI0008955064|nr:Crp/Fnr family transcriptional regulator [Tenacibaculum sp. MAR_2009_124]SEC86263.1 cAMP-binding domain of CRP or a regulatory subunit of cAMP-dependent protein kinases [Tenacibaculum sp. MAR_2009_124]